MDQIAPRTCAQGTVPDPPVPGDSTGARDPPSGWAEEPLRAWTEGNHEK
jgi:hypothetical protein